MECNVCGSEDAILIYRSQGEMSLTSLCTARPGRVSVFACKRCDHIRSEAIAGVGSYYDVEYRILINSDDEDQLYEIKDGRPVFRTQHQVGTLRSKVDIPDGALILDYGSAKGSTLKALLKARPDIGAHFFDVSDMYVDFWRAFVKEDCWATYTVPGDWTKRFDVVTSFFAFEHITDVKDAVRTVRKVLKDSGVFYGVVPHVFENVADLIVIDHINHFTAPSLRYLLREGGFDVVDIDATAHRGALVFRASSAGGKRLVEPVSVKSCVSKAAEIGAFWANAAERLKAFEDAHPGPSAIYGSGFYGAFIMTSISQPSEVCCFLDQNPFQQGRVFFERPVVSPKELSTDIRTLYVGLNPTIARTSIADVIELADRPREYFFFDR